MRRSTPIQRRLADSRPTTVSEALLIAVVKKHKAGPAPALPASTLRRIAGSLGEHPPRVALPSIWPALRAVAAVALALVSLNAVALVGVRVIAAVKIHFGEGRSQAVRARGEPSSTQKPSLPAALPLARPPSPPPLVLAGQRLVVAARATSDTSDTTGRSMNPGEPATVARKSATDWSRAPVPLVAAPNHRRVESVAGVARLPEALSPPPVVVIPPAVAPLATRTSPPSSDWLAELPSVTKPANPPVPTVAATESQVQPSFSGDPLAIEAAQLKRGLELKHAGNLASAISVLEGYRHDHPRGSFWAEATLAELDAMLSLGRREEASNLLQEVGDNPALPRSAELRLLRAELDARQGRCAEALPGFEASLQIPSVSERALYGRANCEQALGRFSESRKGFEDYLSRYPHGVLAAEARRALGLTEWRQEK